MSKLLTTEQKNIIRPEFVKTQSFIKKIEKQIFTEAYADIQKANKIIQKKYRYECGLVSEAVKNEIGMGDLFFESPDGQNGELFHELNNLGWQNSGWNAPYYWGVSKNNVRIQYTEGDIFINLLKK